MFLNTAGYDPEVVTRNASYEISGPIGAQLTVQNTRSSLRIEEK